MSRVAVLVACVLVVGPVATVTGFGTVMGAIDHPDDEEGAAPVSALPAANTSGVGIGTRLVGVLDAHGTAHHQAVAETRVKLRLEGAGSESERGAIVEAVYHRTQERVATLEARITRLSAALENGSITREAYRIRRASITVELRSVQRIATRLESAAVDISIGLLPGIEVTVTDIRSLASHAAALEGDILTSIAPSFRSNTTAATPTTTTVVSSTTVTTTTSAPSVDVDAVLSEAATRVDTAQDRVESMRDTLSGVLITDRLATLRDQATANLSLAEQHLAAARDAHAAGDDERAVALARDAIEYADRAIRKAEEAIELASV